MAIKIPFLAEVTDFLRGTRRLEDALDDVEDALDDVGRNQATDKVEQDLDQLARDAEHDAEKIERAFSDAFDKLKAEGHTATTRVKDDVGDFKTKGVNTTEEFRDEAKQNLAESLSSFQGDAESAVDAVQSTFGGLAANLGPAGIIGVSIAAAGIGIARGLWEKSQEAAEEFRARVDDLAGALIEAGGALDRETITDRLREMVTDSETIRKIFGVDLPEALDRLGSGRVTNVLEGLVDPEETQRAIDEIDAQLADLRSHTGKGRLVGPIVQETGRLQDSRDALQQQLRATKDAEKIQDAYARTTLGAAEALQAENDALSDNAALKGDAVRAGISLEQAQDDLRDAYSDNGKSLDINTQKGRDNAAAILDVIDAANGWADAQLEAGATVEDVNAGLARQQGALVKTLTKFGLTKDEAKAYIRTLGGIPARKSTEVTVTDRGTAKTTKAKIDAAAAARTADIAVNASLEGVDRKIRNYFNGKTYTFNVAPRPGKNVAS